MWLHGLEKNSSKKSAFGQASSCVEAGALHWVRNRVGLCGSPGGAGSTVSWEHPSELEAQSNCGMEDLGREALELDVGEDEGRYSTNP